MAARVPRGGAPRGTRISRGGSRAPGTSGALLTHQPHLSSVVNTSQDGRRATERSSAIDMHAAPEYYQDDSVTNAAVESWDSGYDLGDNSLAPDSTIADPTGINVKTKKKKKKNENSVRMTAVIAAAGLNRFAGEPVSNLGQRTPRRVPG